MGILDSEIDRLRKKVAELEEEVKWLHCLEAAGVDNWEGVDYAQEMMEDE